MKIELPDILPPAFNQLIHRPGSMAYRSMAVISGLIVLVWVLFSSFGIPDLNGWLPYHVPVSIFLSLVLLILALRSWIKMLLSGEPPSSAAREQPQQRPETRSKPRPVNLMFRKPRRVLVVDDDRCVRMVLCRKLSSLGVRASGVSDGLEALLAVSDRQWDMVLMDGQMPFMDGIEATRQIRCQRLLPDSTPIIGISSVHDWTYHQRCLSAGMTACRPKPRHTEDLETLLDEFLVMGDVGDVSTAGGRIMV